MEENFNGGSDKMVTKPTRLWARVVGISLPVTVSNSWIMPPFFQTLDESASIDDFVEE